jgi:hypothetical protein
MVKVRASRYRGVYRCGNKWKAQVKIQILFPVFFF